MFVRILHAHRDPDTNPPHTGTYMNTHTHVYLKAKDVCTYLTITYTDTDTRRHAQALTWTHTHHPSHLILHFFSSFYIIFILLFLSFLRQISNMYATITSISSYSHVFLPFFIIFCIYNHRFYILCQPPSSAAIFHSSNRSLVLSISLFSSFLPDWGKFNLIFFLLASYSPVFEIIPWWIYGLSQ